MTMEIRRATRQGVKPLIALYSESGCGKTYSALFLARGLVGPQGKIVLIDSESGRGSLYADVLPGGYDTLALVAPFSPGRYVEAIDAAEQAGADCVIIDSGTHEWEGAGGVLDMAAEIEERTGKTGLHCWRKPKFQHALFVSRLLRSNVAIIVCLRAKHKTRVMQVGGGATSQTRDFEKNGESVHVEVYKDRPGKTQIVRDDYTSPIQADDFIFEATAHAEIMPDHSCRLTKCSHPVLKECFPVKGPITIGTGEAIARWCAAPGGSAPVGKIAGMATVTPPAQAPKQAAGNALDIHALKAKLWSLTSKIHCCTAKSSPADKAAGLKELQQWLWDESLMGPDERLDDMLLSGERLSQIIKNVEAHNDFA